MTRTWLGSGAVLLLSAAWASAQVPAQAPAPSAPSVPVEVYAPPAGDAPSAPPLGKTIAPAGDRYWFQAEYLLWDLKNSSLPAIFGTVPTGLILNNQPLLPGAINPIFGGPDSLDYRMQSGLRLTAGYWIDEAHEWGFEGSWFQLETKNIDFAASSPGNPVIGPVYNDPVQGRQVILLYSTPPGGPAGLDPRSANLVGHADNHLWGAEANLDQRITSIFSDRLDLLYGFRHLQFGEGLQTAGISVPGPGADPLAPTVAYQDSFTVLNQFYGAQIGLHAHSQFWDCLTLDVTGKLALGGIVETAKVNGQTTLSNPITGSQTFPGGILAQPTNMGTFSRGRVAWVPELILSGGYCPTSWSRLFVSYDFLYVDQLIRVGDQIGGVDGRQIQGAASFDGNARVTQPQPPNFSDTRFWAQGLNLGLEIKF